MFPPVMLYLFLPVLLLPACSSPVEERAPRLGPLLEDGDRVVIHRPVTATPDSGTTLERYLLTDPEKQSDKLVRSFPDAAPRLQSILGRILDRSLPPTSIPFDVRSQIPIPYSYSKSTSPVVLKLRLSDRSVFHDDPQEMFQRDAESGADAVLSGRIRKTLFGFSSSIKQQLNESIPTGTALIRIRTTWTAGIRSGDRVRMERFEVNDHVEINLNKFSVRLRERYFSSGRAVDLLLRRIAWRVASRFLPHRFDTSAGDSDST